MLPAAARRLRPRLPQIRVPRGRLHAESDGESRVVTLVNDTFRRFPRESVMCLIGAEIVSIYGTYSLLKAMHVDVAPEFAVAFAVARPLRRLRFPVELMLTVAMARKFPALTRIRVTNLAGALPSFVRSKSSKITDSSVGQKVRRAVDDYGAAYFLSARAVGAGTVCGMYACLKQGIDLEELLRRWGINEIGDVLGQWAAAVTLSTVLYPVSVLVATHAARRVGGIRTRVWK